MNFVIPVIFLDLAQLATKVAIVGKEALFLFPDKDYAVFVFYMMLSYFFNLSPCQPLHQPLRIAVHMSLNQSLAPSLI
jgi:hypothetical protein